MSKKKEKQSYLTQSDCLKIIEYSNDLLNSLAESFRYQNCDNCFDYQRKFYNLKLLFQVYIQSFVDKEDM